VITSYEDLSVVRQEAGGTPIFLKAGTFDLFHEGHENALDFLRSLGGISVVGVSPDSRVRHRKGPDRPIRSENTRVRDVEDSGLADYVFIVPDGVFGVPRSINRLRPEAFVEHQSDSKALAITKGILGLASVNYIVDNNPRICSTTEIIERQTRLASA
jgi:cytidyltransferase-like protein